MLIVAVCIFAISIFLFTGVLSIGYWYPPRGHQAKTDKPMEKSPKFKSSVRRV